jgi:hypothetical protein
MEEIHEKQCASLGMKMSVLFATLGVSAPVIIMFAWYLEPSSDPIGRKRLIPLGIIVTLAALYLVAAFMGRDIGKSMCRHRHSYGKAILAGIGLALSCLVVVGATMTSFNAVIEPGASVFSVMVAIFLVVLIGALPAILLGILYGVLVRWLLIKAGCLEGS